MQHMAISLSADMPVHQIDFLGARFGLTAIQQIRPGAPYAVFDKVREENSEEDRDQQAEVSDVDFVDGGTE